MRQVKCKACGLRFEIGYDSGHYECDFCGKLQFKSGLSGDALKAYITKQTEKEKESKSKEAEFERKRLNKSGCKDPTAYKKEGI
jgi:hypothetical protein